jgi:hypothetical protein
MAAKTKYQVRAALIVVKVPGAQGGEVYLHRGRPVPAAVEPDETKRLLSLGLIERAPEKPVDEGDSPNGQASEDPPADQSVDPKK